MVEFLQPYVLPPWTRFQRWWSNDRTLKAVLGRIQVDWQGRQTEWLVDLWRMNDDWGVDWYRRAPMPVAGQVLEAINWPASSDTLATAVRPA